MEHKHQSYQKNKKNKDNFLLLMKPQKLNLIPFHQHFLIKKTNKDHSQDKTYNFKLKVKL